MLTCFIDYLLEFWDVEVETPVAEDDTVVWFKFEVVFRIEESDLELDEFVDDELLFVKFEERFAFWVEFVEFELIVVFVLLDINEEFDVVFVELEIVVEFWVEMVELEFVEVELVELEFVKLEFFVLLVELVLEVVFVVVLLVDCNILRLILKLFDKFPFDWNGESFNIGWEIGLLFIGNFILNSVLSSSLSIVEKL